MIIETSDNRFFSVRETGNPDLAHVWLGIEVMFNIKRQVWVKRANRRGNRPPQLVRKEATRVVAMDGRAYDA